MNSAISAFFVAAASLTASVALTVGSTAPDFTVTDIAGDTLKLDAMALQGPVVLAFFPMANTSGCTEEMSNLAREADSLTRTGARIIAVSGDSAAKLKEFQSKAGAHFSFVADDKGFLMQQYGVKMPILNKSRRTTLVIGRDKAIKMILKEGDAVALTGLQQKLDELKAAP